MTGIRATCTWLPAIALLGLLQATEARAASQGSMGASSSGSVTISASVQSRVNISGLNDIEFGDVGPSQWSSRTQDLCVVSNAFLRPYTISALGSGSAGDFELSSGSRTIDYAVQWSSGEGQGSSHGPFNSSTILNLHAGPAEAACHDGRGLARLTVSVASRSLLPGERGDPYTGILTLIIAPQ